MIKSGYVVAVIANGNILDEDDSKRVAIPFGTEYKVRLINKNNERCAADLVINGEQVARFIVNAGETTDIERYLDGNLNSGSKFKFTHLNDSKVKDKNDFENGLVEVRFYREIKRKEPLVIREEHHHHHWDLPWNKQPEPWKPANPIWYGTTSDSTVYGASTVGDSINFCAKGMCNTSLTSAPADGATVRGSSSGQKFSEVSGYEFESFATVMKVKIVNGELHTAAKYCSGCGKHRQPSVKYCSNCGNKF